MQPRKAGQSHRGWKDAARKRRLPVASYAHMCRDGHIQIGHNDSEHEECPYCRLLNLLDRVEDEYSDDQYLSLATLSEIREVLDARDDHG